VNRPAPAPVRAATMALPFPRPGRTLDHAYRELTIALNGSAEQIKALGDLRLLARPWDPPTCAEPQLRKELWEWLEQVVIWLNSEYVWDVAGIIPPCWPRHPHLVHEIAVLADQRRRAGLAFASDPLEEWHRYCLPAFIERMKNRTKSHCEEKEHQRWPALGRYTRHTASEAVDARAAAYRADLIALDPPRPPASPAGPRLHVVDGLRVDLGSGEVLD